jgi:fumarate hydratase subunit beta
VKQSFEHMTMKHIDLPLSEADLSALRAGDFVLLTGPLLTARDASHKKMVGALEKGDTLPFSLDGQTIYYTGPTPTRPGEIIGSAGPTTSGRMDDYTVALLERGLKCTIGKGQRSPSVKAKFLECGAIYLAVTGGTGALIAKTVISARVIAFPELEAEAVHLLEVRDFPAVVINDIYGSDLYQLSREKYQGQASAL